MNAIFTAVILSSAIVITFLNPDRLLPALLGGAKNAALTCLTLFCIYALWLGLSRLAEQSGLSERAAKALNPFAKRVFGTKNMTAVKNISMNLACNLLGIGGAATPYAVKAIDELEKDGNDFAQKLLFIINATSVQIIPSTVIALRVSEGSIAAADIFLPSLICTAVSTAAAVLIFICGNRLWH